MVLLQLQDCTNIQTIARNTIYIGPLPTTFPRHSVGCMKGEAMDMITIHTIALGYPLTAFNCLHGGPSHGYNYSPYHTPGNDPHPSFGIVHEGRSYGFDHGLYNRASDIPPPTFGSAHKQLTHYFDHNPNYSVMNDPPPTFCLHVTSRNREEEEYQQQLEEATRQSQFDYRRKLEEDNCFYSMQRDAIHYLYPG